jgi:hypothetical protein
VEGPARGVEVDLSRSESSGRRSFLGRTSRRLIDGIVSDSSGESSHFERRFQLDSRASTSLPSFMMAREPTTV